MPAYNRYTLQINQTITLTVTDAASDGRGVARADDKVFFVEGGIPGDTAEVRLFAREKKFWVGRIESLLTPSPDRIEPQCEHFGTCGGCKWQQMNYSAQLHFKEKQVRDAFERIAKVPFGELKPIIGCENHFEYRNKVDFACSEKRWLSRAEMQSDQTYEGNVMGFHVPKYFDKVIEIRHCHLTDGRVNHVRNALQAYGRTNGLTFYDARSHVGYLRNIVIRTSDTELMLILIVGADRPELLTPLIAFIRKELPAVTSLITIINTKHNDSYTDLPFTCEYGTPFITERLGKYRFEVGPLSFFQTNTRQTERLYQTVSEFLPEKSNIIYDLYCGTGSIGIFISEQAEKVVGIEYVPSAVEDAYRNANLNSLEHLSFHAGDMAKLLTDDFTRLHGTPEVVISDPPRAGMDAKVVGQLLRLLPERIVYVSCTPATQARDVALLAAQYSVQTLQPVDMFPHTTHVENVALLTRNR